MAPLGYLPPAEFEEQHYRAKRFRPNPWESTDDASSIPGAVRDLSGERITTVRVFMSAL